MSDTFSFENFTMRFTDTVFYFNDWFDQAYPAGADISKFALFFSQYFPEVWFGDNTKLQSLFIWIVLVLVILIAITIKQANNYKKSKENETQNVFSGTFYMMFFVFLYLSLNCNCKYLKLNKKTRL